MIDADELMRQAQTLIHAERVDEASVLVEQVLAVQPGHPTALNTSAFILLRRGRLKEAMARAKQAIDAAPGKAEPAVTGALVLIANERADNAVTLLEEVIAVHPNRRNVHVALVWSYICALRFFDAYTAAKNALTKFPDDSQLLSNLAVATCGMGEAEHAAEVLYKIIALQPGNPGAVSAYAGNAHYIPGFPPEQVAEAHRLFGRMTKAKAPGTSWEGKHLGTKDPERPLRVGVLSPDLHSHSVARFIEPVLERLQSDRTRLFIYYTSPVKDSINTRMRTFASTWHDCPHRTAGQLAGMIHEDAIDVLVELSGLTDGNRLDALALRPAPVQATYLGYPDTTGCDFVDYRLVDSLTDPPAPASIADSLCSERLVRIDPCFLCFRPRENSPGPRPPMDASGTGPITFGSFGSLAKYSEKLIYIWSRVLSAVPDSRLLLKWGNVKDRRIHERVMARFKVYGVDPSRIEVLPALPSFADHLAVYHRIDIVLDTFPYHGTTTTCEALYMGLPSISLVGPSHVSRVGLSLLSAVGLADLAAKDEAEYVEIARRLAHDRARVSHLHATLRDTFMRSPVGDEAAFVQRFETTLRGLWRAHCASQVGR